jgi:hypothetical protein
MGGIAVSSNIRMGIYVLVFVITMLAAKTPLFSIEGDDGYSTNLACNRGCATSAPTSRQIKVIMRKAVSQPDVMIQNARLVVPSISTTKPNARLLSKGNIQYYYDLDMKTIGLPDNFTGNLVLAGYEHDKILVVINGKVVCVDGATRPTSFPVTAQMASSQRFVITDPSKRLLGGVSEYVVEPFQVSPICISTQPVTGGPHIVEKTQLDWQRILPVLWQDPDRFGVPEGYTGEFQFSPSADIDGITHVAVLRRGKVVRVDGVNRPDNLPLVGENTSGPSSRPFPDGIVEASFWHVIWVVPNLDWPLTNAKPSRGLRTGGVPRSESLSELESFIGQDYEKIAAQCAVFLVMDHEPRDLSFVRNFTGRGGFQAADGFMYELTFQKGKLLKFKKLTPSPPTSSPVR